MSQPLRHHATTDDFPRLAAHQLQIAGAFVPGAVTRWAVRAPTGTTSWVRAEDCAKIMVAIDDGPEFAIATISHDGTLGGTITLFRCPSCGTRRRHLYLKSAGTLTCRDCSGLLYASRHRHQQNRPLLRASRLRTYLATTPRIPRRKRRQEILARIKHLEQDAREKAAGSVKDLKRIKVHDD